MPDSFSLADSKRYKTTSGHPRRRKKGRQFQTVCVFRNVIRVYPKHGLFQNEQSVSVLFYLRKDLILVGIRPGDSNALRLQSK